MKVLIVCSGNSEFISPFINEQADAIKDLGIEVNIFLIIGKGIWGYLKNLKRLKNVIVDYSPDIIHAHYGLSGLLAVLQRRVPVVITFHGSDANISKVKLLSVIAAGLSRFNIFVSDKLKTKIKGNKKYAIVPCGINLDIFYPIDMYIAREKLKMEPEKKYILFSSFFDNSIKNSPLAFSAIKKLQLDCELIELKNRSREEVNLLLNACNLLLLTSISEGSPQIIKEAMACNCPIVATDVGDIREVISDTEGCYLTSFEPDDVADKIKYAISFNKRTNGHKKIKHFDKNIIAKKIFDIYQTVINKEK